MCRFSTNYIPLLHTVNKCTLLRKELAMSRYLPTNHLIVINCEHVPVDLSYCHLQIGINHGLTAAYVGHHYAGPGNHFCEH